MVSKDKTLSMLNQNWTVKKEKRLIFSTFFNHSDKTNLNQIFLSVHNVWNSSDLARNLYNFSATQILGYKNLYYGYKNFDNGILFRLIEGSRL